VVLRTAEKSDVAPAQNAAQFAAARRALKSAIDAAGACCMRKRTMHMDPIIHPLSIHYPSIHHPSIIPSIIPSTVDAAARREDYATAAQLKRELDRINGEDPFFLLNKELATCITEQRFQVQ
jgi:hypothetical protein